MGETDDDARKAGESKGGQLQLQLVGGSGFVVVMLMIIVSGGAIGIKAVAIRMTRADSE